jgi:hypothetical protein
MRLQLARRSRAQMKWLCFLRLCCNKQSHFPIPERSSGRCSCAACGYDWRGCAAVQPRKKGIHMDALKFRSGAPDVAVALHAATIGAAAPRSGGGETAT